MSAIKQGGLSGKVVAFSLVAIVACALFIAAGFWILTEADPASEQASFYVGVTTGGSAEQSKATIDKVKDYTNVIAFTNLTVTMNLTSLLEVADYAYDKGLSFFVQQSYPSPFSHYNYDPIAWASQAKERYGNNFLGYYLYDEPGGSQLDQGQGEFIQFDSTSGIYDHRDAANTYVYYLYIQMRDFMKNTSLVTSDYALYWYDYEAGYDTVMVQFGWNNSRAINIALCRGAAEMHNKTWGAMITWTCQEFPYLESASELYQDLVTAYDAGAKYVMVFNYPQVEPYGVMNESHFDALKQFWDYTQRTPQNRTSNTQKVAYVLPDNYGFGFRNSADSIWGVFGPDNMTSQIWTNVNVLAQTYGNNFDIIYGSPWSSVFARFHYDKLIPWNGTIPTA